MSVERANPTVEVHAEYDAEAGILDVWIGAEPRPAMSYESPDGTLVRRAFDDGQVCGFTIFDWRPALSGDAESNEAKIRRLYGPGTQGSVS